jgi:hypothetical protein
VTNEFNENTKDYENVIDIKGRLISASVEPAISWMQ